MPQCAACQRELAESELKCYTVRRGNERHQICFCRACYSAFEKETRTPSGDRKVGKAVKGVVGTLGAIGLVLMTIVFSVALLVLKQMMKTKYGSEGEGEGPTFGSGGSGVFTGPGDGDEPMLGDFKSSDLMGYEVSDDAGETHQTDDLINQLYSDQGTFSEGEAIFFRGNSTFSGDET